MTEMFHVTAANRSIGHESAWLLGVLESQDHMLLQTNLQGGCPSVARLRSMVLSC